MLGLKRKYSLINPFALMKSFSLDLPKNMNELNKTFKSFKLKNIIKYSIFKLMNGKY